MQRSTPWAKILTCRAVWAVCICQFGILWNIASVNSLAPTYFKHIHCWTIGMAGFLSGIPNLLKVGFSFVVAAIVDFILRNNKMSRTNIRKLCGGIATFGQVISAIGLAYSGNHPVLAIFWYTMSQLVHSTGPSGPMANQIDISPNYAGIILGISSSITAMPGYIVPYIIGVLTLNNVSVCVNYIVFI